jgi:ATP-binding cassette subfamily B protein
MIRLFKYLKPYTLLLLLDVGLVYVQVVTSLALPEYMAKIVNIGIVGKDNAFIIDTGLRMLLISLLGAACMIMAGYLSAKIAAGFSTDIRHKVFAKVESFSLAEFNTFSTASLITRSTNDIQQIQMVVIIILRMVLMAPMMGVGAIFKAYHEAPSLSWIMALAVVVMVGIILVLFAVALPRFQLLQKLVDKLNLVTRENLTGLRVIRAFNNEKIEQGKFEKANVDLTNANLFVNRLMVIMQPMMMLIFNITAVGIIWYGSHLVNTGDLMIGDMMAFMQYTMQVIMSFLMLSIIFIMIPRASVSATRVAEVIDTEPIIQDPDRPVKKGTGQGLVEFDHVTFTYPGADTPALEDISFTAQPGQTTAFIGSTGSGKSTLMNLIPRLYDVNQGRILIDGVNIRDMKLEELYSIIGYVPQKAVLFSGTIEDNIRYGEPKATEEAVKEAARIAQAKEFIDELEGKYRYEVAQGGTNVSGGQKQRLSIARAIVRDPEIYIFDDSFSSLDLKTDSLLREALKKVTKDKTVLIVAQRISTIMSAEKIIVLDEGSIVAQGTHRELLRSCPIYREIAASQLSEEELQEQEGEVETGGYLPNQMVGEGVR